MIYDKKQFLDLLLEYRSDETKKARRNTSVIAFVILSAWYLDLRLSNMTVLGMNVSKASELPVLTIALVLLIYWTGMFLLSSLQDAEIQKERAFILDEQIKFILDRQEKIEKAKKEDKHWMLSYQDHAEIKATVQAIKHQKNRTKRALLVVTCIRRLEYFVPIVTSALSGIALIQMMSM